MPNQDEPSQIHPWHAEEAARAQELIERCIGEGKHDEFMDRLHDSMHASNTIRENQVQEQAA